MKCKELYIGETANSLRQRLHGHLSDIRTEQEKPVAQHFSDIFHTPEENMVIYPIEQILEQGSDEKNKKKRLQIEAKWIKALDTMYPTGMNLKLVEKKSIAFTTLFNATSNGISNIIRDTYKNLQQLHPTKFRDELIIGYRKNQNLSNKLVSAKLK